VLPELISQWEKKLGVSPKSIFVQKMKTQWGSCNHKTKNIRLNTELTKKPKQYLDYVVLHEMAHLLKPTHSKEFISILDEQMPMWREFKKGLNRLPVGS
jgi:predicted metal-dependent hydrolase